MDFWCNQNSRDLFAIIVTAVVLWSIPWKALALWKSARQGHKWWFIAFMLVNTVGLLEIFYLLILPRFNPPKRNK